MFLSFSLSLLTDLVVVVVKKGQTQASLGSNLAMLTVVIRYRQAIILYHSCLGRKGSGYRVWNTGWSWPDTVDRLMQGGLEMNACSNWRGPGETCEPWTGGPSKSKFVCGIGQRSGLSWCGLCRVA